MPITFSMNQDDGYFVAQYEGAISDKDLLDEWRSVLSNIDPIPNINQLADLSDADLSGLTTTGIKAIADYFIFIYRKYNVTSMKTAIYAPQSLSYGLSRIYEVLAYESAQDIKVFNDREKAIQWLTTGK